MSLCSIPTRGPDYQIYAHHLFLAANNISGTVMQQPNMTAVDLDANA